MNKKVVIVGGVRTPFVKSFSSYKDLSNLDLASAVLKELVNRYQLQGKVVGEVALGAVMSHPADWNLSREAVLSSGLSPDTPAHNTQKACGTSLENVIGIANKIALGQIECGIAGGTDTNSDAPVVFSRNASKKIIQLAQARSIKERIQLLTKFSFKDLLPVAPSVQEPRTGLSMGEHCELMVKDWHIGRAEQDQLAYESHKKAAQAYGEKFFEDLVMKFNGLERDGILRESTTVEKLSTLKPAFDKSGKGTLSAGNSTALTDGTAVVFLASEEYAKANNLPILAYFVDGQSAAVNFVEGEGLLMAPTLAVSQLLERQQRKLQDFDFYEIHEAFAGQVLSTLKAWEDTDYCQNRLGRESALGSIDRSKLNVKGSSLATGHPFAATGARITATLGKILASKGEGTGLISICTAGGMGVAAILERPGQGA